MPRQNLKVQFFNDFTGGLNNNQSRQNLLPNESPDCQDVVFDNRGGFRTRNGYTTPLTQSVLNGGYIGGQFSAGTEVLWGITNVGGLWTWNGATFTAVTTSNPVDAGVAVRGAVWGSKLYFANWLSSGTYYMRYWNGSSFTALTNTANNNYTAPAGGNAPLARLIANHSGHMWWADTVESSVRYRSRLRFSHPLQPEDFATDDYFDIEPDDQTDQITALFPFRDMLLVFKRRSVYAVYGYDRESFVVQKIAGVAGVSCQDVIDGNAGVVYWWSIDGNVYAFNGTGVVPIGDRIKNVVNEGLAISGCLTNRVTWVENQLWVSLNRTDGSRVMFVYDPSVGRAGAWTKFSFAPTSMFWWKPAASATRIVFTLQAQGYLFQYGRNTQEFDQVGSTSFVIPAYYRMAWFSAMDTGLKKRWARPTVSAASNGEGSLIAEVFHDFEESLPERTLSLPLTPISYGGMVWGDDWGDDWAGSGEVAYTFSKFPSFGRSNALQVLFRVSGSLNAWWIDSVAVPYLEKTYR